MYIYNNIKEPNNTYNNIYIYNYHTMIYIYNIYNITIKEPNDIHNNIYHYNNNYSN